MSRELEGFHVPTVVRELSQGFDPAEEMIQFGDLRRRSYAALEKQLRRVHKLLILHRGKPGSVMIAYEDFQELVRYLEEVEARLEELELSTLGDARYRWPVRSDDFVEEEVFHRRLGELSDDR